MKAFVESKFFEKFVALVIVLNAMTLGLETSQSIDSDTRFFLSVIDQVFLAFFVFELLLRFAAYRLKFFTDPWRIFDLAVVSVSLFPSTGQFSILRALRVLRTLRMVSVIPSLKKVVSGLLAAIPGMGAVTAIMSIIFYVSAVMATKLFGADFPEWFGSMAASSYSLFQIMTLESWSMGIVRPVMEKAPYAWIFFVPFILATTFTMLNLFIAVLVNSMSAETDAQAEKRADLGHDERIEILEELKAIRKEMARQKGARRIEESGNPELVQ